MLDIDGVLFCQENDPLVRLLGDERRDMLRERAGEAMIKLSTPVDEHFLVVSVPGTTGFIFVVVPKDASDEECNRLLAEGVRILKRRQIATIAKNN